MKGVKLCPRCGKPGSGPYLKRISGDRFGLYFEHLLTVDGIRRIRWHHIPTGVALRAERREMLVRLVKKHGWMGMRRFASLLHVSERTVRRDLDTLRAEGRIIHRNYGGYIADPSGTLLKEKPWIAWG
jgi:biotin operon repressor